MMIKIFNIAFVGVSICYPLALYFINIDFVAIIMGILWAFKAIISKESKILSMLVSIIFFVIAINVQYSILENLAFFYPSIINIMLLVLFASSLKGEAFITKIARMQDGNLNEKRIAYTRKLTLVWCYLFIFNGILGGIFALMDNKIYWSIFCGIIAYILVGILFGGEILYRKYIKRW